jgi:hypothetical protein
MKHKVYLSGLFVFMKLLTASAHSYDASTGNLSISSIDVGNTTYSNVVVKLASVQSVGGASPAPAFPWIGTWTSSTVYKGNARIWNNTITIKADNTYTSTLVADDGYGTLIEVGQAVFSNNSITTTTTAVTCYGSYQCPKPGIATTMPWVITGNGFGSQVVISDPSAVHPITFTKIGVPQ